MGAVRELIAKFESEANNKPLKETDTLLDKLSKKSGVVGDAFKHLKTALGGAAIAGGIVAFAHEFVAEAENLQYTSDRLRTTTHDLQLMGAVGRSVGLDLNATAGVMATLRGKVDEAARGIGDGGYTFRRLGVQVRDSNRQVRPLAQIFGDVATGLSRVNRQSRQLILTDRLLGTEGRRFVSLFAEGRDALSDFATLMEESGGGISQESIDAGLRLSRAWNIAGLSMDSMRSRVALFLLPQLEKLVRLGTRVLNFLNKTTIETNGLKIAFVALGTYGARSAIMWAAANAPLVMQFGLIAAAVAVVVLVVDDLINLFTGGQSVIGGFIDELFGVGTAAEVVNDLKGRFDEFLFAVRVVKEEIMALWDAIHIGYNARTDPRAAATRTPIRARTAPPVPGAPPPVPSAAFRNALRGIPGLPSVSVPLAALPAPGRAVPAPGIRVPAPGGSGGGRVVRSEINLNSQPRVEVHINNPTGNGAEIGRQATPAILRALQTGNRESVRALQDSGLVPSRREEPED